MAAPLEYVIIGFPDNAFTGEIVPALAALVDSGVIRIVDLVFATRADDGAVVVLEVDEHDHLSVFAALEGDVGGAIGPEDIHHALEAAEAGSSVLLMMWEDLWAAPLVSALRRAGGELIEGGRIPAAIAQDLDVVLGR